MLEYTEREREQDMDIDLDRERNQGRVKGMKAKDKLIQGNFKED
jgi:hypothetical protein